MRNCDKVRQGSRTALCCLNLGGWPRFRFFRGCGSVRPFGVAAAARGSFLLIRVVSEPEVFFVFLFRDNLWGAPMRRGNTRHWYIIHEGNKVPSVFATLLEGCSGWGLHVRRFHGIPPWTTSRWIVILTVRGAGAVLARG